MYDFLLPKGLLDGTPPFWYAIVSGTSLGPFPIDTKPRVALEGSSTAILILEPGGEDDAFVSHYDRTLAFISDTWYETREAAMRDCAESFATAGEWLPIPDEAPNAEDFVLAAIRTSSTR